MQPYLRASIPIVMAVSLALHCALPTTTIVAGTLEPPDGGALEVSDAEPDRRDTANQGTDRMTAGCAESSVDLTMPTAEVMLVVERSAVMGTMNDSTCSTCGTYWSSLIDCVATLTGATSNHFRWGLKVFPSADATDACMVSSAVEVTPARDTKSAILAVLGSLTQQGQAPVAPAVSAVRDYFERRSNDVPRFVVLAMGGIPTCGSGTPEQDDFTETRAQIAHTAADAFVLGFGTAVDQLERLAPMADTGYAATDIQKLLVNMEVRARLDAACIYSTPHTALPGQAIHVFLDNVPLTEDDTNGFVVSHDSSSITLQGTVCRDIGSHASLTVRVGCEG